MKLPFKFNPSFLPLGLFVFLFIWTETPFHLRPDWVASSRFLLSDEASCLWLVDAVCHGQALYRDVSSSYGPLPVCLYLPFAYFFGNSAETYIRLEQIYTLAIAVLLWIFLRRHFHRLQATVVWLVFLAPYMLFVGCFLAAYDQEPYAPERLLLVILVLLWKPAPAASARYMVLIGAVMAATQFVKFGSGVMAMGAWILSDIWVGPLVWPQLIQRWIYLLLGYLAVTAIWAVALLCWLPWPLALDTFCPLYAAEAYKLTLALGSRWPHYSNLGYFMGMQVGLVAGFLLSLGTIVMVGVEAREHGPGPAAKEAGPFVFAGFFYLLGIAFFIRHEWHFFIYGWLAILSGAWAWNRLPGLCQLGVFVLCLPLFWLHVREPWRPSPTTVQRILMPDGQTLWLDEKTADEVQRVNAIVTGLISRHPSRTAIFAYPISCGWCHYLNWRPASRNVWILPGYIRPYDEQVLIDSLQRTAAVIVVPDFKVEAAPTTDPGTWTLVPSTFSNSLRAAFEKKLGPPIAAGNRCWVFPVLPDRP